MVRINRIDISEALQRANERALERIGEMAAARARESCEEDIRKSIVHQVDGLEVTIRSDDKRAVNVELGTPTEPARPFLRPALEDHAEEYKQILIDELRNA